MTKFWNIFWIVLWPGHNQEFFLRLYIVKNGEQQLFNKPTTINNTETFAAVPFVFQVGAKEYAALGKPNNGGTKIFSVSGDVAKPGNYEVPLGTPFATLLELAGGMRDGKKIKAVIPCGSSMPVLTGDVMMQTDMDYDSIAKAGSMLG